MITTIIDDQKLTVSGDWGFLVGFLDLLQTSAFLVAATALVGTATATGINRLSTLLIPSGPSHIRVEEIKRRLGRSLLRRLSNLGIWIWYPALLVFFSWRPRKQGRLHRDP